MSQYRVTTNHLVSWGANQWLRNESEENKAALLEPTKRNLLIYGFNGSTVALVASVASAIFFSMASAGFLMGVGLFVRYVTSQELANYLVRSDENRLTFENWALWKNPVLTSGIVRSEETHYGFSHSPLSHDVPAR